MNEHPYATWQALEQAVKSVAGRSSRNSDRIFNDFVIDRFLCRIFSEASPAFVLKGGRSQLARRIDARETRDTDLVGLTREIGEALDTLKQLASVDLHDYLEYRFKDAKPIPTSQEYRSGMIVRFVPVLGRTKTMQPISIDLVVDQTPPEDYLVVTPANRLEIKGLETHDYAVQTIEERIADKVCATMQLYEGRPSSRVRDLADLVATMLHDDVDADALMTKIKRECSLRHMEPLGSFRIPEYWKELFSDAYSKDAKGNAVPADLQDIQQAEEAVASWLDPLLDGTAQGTTWQHLRQGWF